MWRRVLVWIVLLPPMTAWWLWRQPWRGWIRVGGIALVLLLTLAVVGSFGSSGSKGGGDASGLKGTTGAAQDPSASGGQPSTTTTPPKRKRHHARKRQHTAVTVAVTRVIDGDTIVVATGAHVRLVQIDTPEVSSNECYSTKAKVLLESILPRGLQIRLVADPALDKVDRYGRLLRYVYRGGGNVNVELVRRGAAAPYFYSGDRGRFAGRIYALATAAKKAHRGLWGACPGTLLRPGEAVTTHRPAPPPSSGSGGSGGSGSNCTPGYSPCLPDKSDDYDCAGGSGNGPYYTAPGVTYTVTGSDPYDLDSDGDGFGCE
jgi:endonuclease YncB( thermonuclease family)